VVLPNGKVLPPRWYIRDMMWQVGTEARGREEGVCARCVCVGGGARGEWGRGELWRGR